MNDISLVATDDDSLSICFSDVDSLYSLDGEQYYNDAVPEDGVGLRDSTMTRSSDGTDPKCVEGDGLPLDPSDDDDESIIPLSYYLQEDAAPESSAVDDDDKIRLLTPMSEISVFSCVSITKSQHIYASLEECRGPQAKNGLRYPLSKMNSSRIVVHAMLDKQEKKRNIAVQSGLVSKARRRCTM